MHCVDTSPKVVYKQTQIFLVSEHADTFDTGNAQLVFCCETFESEDKNQNYRQLMSGRNSAH